MKKTKKRRRRCKYYVNTNFFVDLEEGRKEAIEFAKKHRGNLCTSTLLVAEYRAVGRGFVAKRLAKTYGIRVYKVKRSKYVREARSLLGVDASPNTVIDAAHVLIARRLGTVFVTSDKRACKRAIRLGVDCINYREGRFYHASSESS